MPRANHLQGWLGKSFDIVTFENYDTGDALIFNANSFKANYYPGLLALEYELIDPSSSTRVTVLASLFFVSTRSSLRNVTLRANQRISLRLQLGGDVSLFASGCIGRS